jgi:DNA recombination protein RmuC
MMVRMTIVIAAAGAVLAVAAAVCGAVAAAAHARRATRDAVADAVGAIQSSAAAERDAAVQAALSHVEAVSRERLGAQVHDGEVQLAHRHALIDQRLAEVQRDVHAEMARVSSALAELSTRSAESFGDVSARLRAHAQSTQALADTTQSLRAALSNPKARGQWGERMAEDVLRLAGFVEHVNYTKQVAIEGGGIPDFTFPLPKGQTLYMDVKFPLNAYLRYLDAGTDAERVAHRDRFVRDVRLRVRELADRAYATRSGGSLDYVLLFLPNEAIAGFVHECDPTLLDEAMRQKVVLTSPLTLYAMLGVIRQAYDNFMVEQTADEMLGLVGSFGQQYERFVSSLEKLERALDSTRRAFDDVNGPRRRQLERPLAKLEELRRQRGVLVDDSTSPNGEVVSLPAADAGA